MTQPPVAQNILAEFRSSSSLPVLVGTSDGGTSIVKWRCSGDGPRASATDWIALHLARHTGIRVPSPRLITVTPDLIRHTRDGELKDIIMRSLGVNLGIEFIERATPFHTTITDETDARDRRLIFLFDVVFLNIDRTDRNPNMVAADGKLYCIDFAAAMSLRMMMNGESYSERALLAPLRRHPFYDDVHDCRDGFPPISHTALRDIVHSIPTDWLSNNEEVRERLIAGTEEMFTDARSIFERRMSVLRTLERESDEDYKKRTSQNRIAFETATGRRL